MSQRNTPGTTNKRGRPPKRLSAGLAALQALAKTAPAPRRSVVGFEPGSMWADGLPSTRSTENPITDDDNDDASAVTTVDAVADALRRQYRQLQRKFATVKANARRLNANTKAFATLTRRFETAKRKMQAGRALHPTTKRNLLNDVSLVAAVAITFQYV